MRYFLSSFTKTGNLENLLKLSGGRDSAPIFVIFPFIEPNCVKGYESILISTGISTLTKPISEFGINQDYVLYLISKNEISDIN